MGPGTGYRARTEQHFGLMMAKSPFRMSSSDYDPIIPGSLIGVL
jgi:hypothetical protein